MNGHRSVPLCVLSLIIALGEVPMRAAPVAVGALAAGSFGDASGHSAQSHLVCAANAGVWWLFRLTSSADSVGGPTHIVKAYRSSSSDLATVAASGTTAIVNDVAPTADRYNLTICEVRGRLQ